MKWTRIEDKRIICTGHIMDVKNRRQIDGELVVEDGKIAAIVEKKIADEAPYLMPGFVDSHVHVESSMMVPMEFAQIALSHGTIGAIADPHEIGNVLGVKGIDFMLDSAKRTSFHFAFGAPSCVPSCSSDFETAGATLDSSVIRELMQRSDIHFLGEMMNYPGVLAGDGEVMAKIQAALDCGKRVDGHAPGVLGEYRKKYAAAGITTDHECSTIDEAVSCIENGMKVLIREGSAAKNFDALCELIPKYHDSIMFCTDDCHPADFIHGHIDQMVRRSIKKGYDIWDILQVACINPVEHYGENWGMLQIGDAADFISLTDITPHFRVRKTYINGERVYSYNNYATTLQSQIASVESQKDMLRDYPNHFLAKPITIDDIKQEIKPGDTLRVIGASDGSLLTTDETIHVTGDPFFDHRHNWEEIQKIVVVNRHKENAPVQVAYIRGFNLKDGAMACSVAHDCHNIVAIGSSDEMICRAVNRVIEMTGGIVAIAGDEMNDLPLPIAGLLSPLNGYQIAFRSQIVENTARKAGCRFASPFITMAFMCLPVIPSLKITDKGLFDSLHFKFV